VSSLDIGDAMGIGEGLPGGCINEGGEARVVKRTHWLFCYPLGISGPVFWA
jgi:hypothetical protein